MQHHFNSLHYNFQIIQIIERCIFPLKIHLIFTQKVFLLSQLVIFPSIFTHPFPSSKRKWFSWVLPLLLLFRCCRRPLLRLFVLLIFFFLSFFLTFAFANSTNYDLLLSSLNLLSQSIAIHSLLLSFIVLISIIIIISLVSGLSLFYSLALKITLSLNILKIYF